MNSMPVPIGEGGERLRSVLNSGFKPAGRMTICVGETHEARDFKTYCPKVLAGIGASVGHRGLAFHPGATRPRATPRERARTPQGGWRNDRRRADQLSGANAFGGWMTRGKSCMSSARPPFQTA